MAAFCWKLFAAHKGGVMEENMKLLFTIAPSGELTVEGQGITGPACLEKADVYLSGLGIIASQEKKIEYYETAGVEIQQFT
jgi:hypothetical protein